MAAQSQTSSKQHKTPPASFNKDALHEHLARGIKADGPVLPAEQDETIT